MDIYEWFETHPGFKLSFLCKSLGLNQANFKRQLQTKSVPEKHVPLIVGIIYQYGFRGHHMPSEGIVIDPFWGEDKSDKRPFKSIKFDGAGKGRIISHKNPPAAVKVKLTNLTANIPASNYSIDTVNEIKKLENEIANPPDKFSSILAKKAYFHDREKRLKELKK